MEFTFLDIRAQFDGATDPQLQRVSPMALSNLRCTGRHKLCQSQQVSAPVNVMRVFWMSEVKIFGWDAFSEVSSHFLIVGDC